MSKGQVPLDKGHEWPGSGLSFSPGAKRFGGLLTITQQGFACCQDLPTTPQGDHLLGLGPGHGTHGEMQPWLQGSSLPWHSGNRGPQLPTVPLEATHLYLKVLRVAGDRERQEEEPELERLREQSCRLALLGGLW